MFNHPAWAVDSSSSGPPAKGIPQIQVNPTKVFDHQSHPVYIFNSATILPCPRIVVCRDMLALKTKDGATFESGLGGLQSRAGSCNEMGFTCSHALSALPNALSSVVGDRKSELRLTCLWYYPYLKCRCDRVRRRRPRCRCRAYRRTAKFLPSLTHSPICQIMALLSRGR